MDDGGVWLAYQPQVDAIGRVLGVEALARWTHPTKGPISPAAFVPLAEDCGLIDALGQLVMRRAFTDSHRWKGLRVAVNVSALQMRQADFPDQVALLLHETGARAEGIELEITEGALLGDDERGTVLIETVGAGSVLGWSWLFPPYYSHFDARAVSPVKTIFFYGTRLREQCESDHELGFQLMKRVAGIFIERLQAARKKLSEQGKFLPLAI
jgi:hypothetical protein